MTSIKAQPRVEIGKKVKSLRKKGLLPAVVYGESIETKPITVSYRDFEKTLKEAGESTLVTLEVDGSPYNVLIHDVGVDVLSGRPIHADFLAVRMDKEITTTVPLEFIGESPAIKNEGGILVKVIHEVEVEALPKNLPHILTVDISALAELESKLHIKDITLPSGVSIKADADEIVALVETPRAQEELEKAPEAAGVVEVKTEQEEKRSREEQEKQKEQESE